MKKISLVFCLLLTFFSFAQKKSYTELKERRNPEEIRQYINENPKDPINGKLRYLLLLRREEIKNQKKEKKTYSIKDFRAKIAEKRAEYKTGDNVLGTERPDYRTDNRPVYTYENNVKTITSPSSNNNSEKEDIEILNHLFSTSKNKTKAYIEVKNLSTCPIHLIIKGQQTFSLNISSGEEGRLLVPKGIYTFSGKICSNNYSEKKKLTGDISITLK